MKRVLAASAAVLLLSATSALAQTIYPIDRAEILSGARFDFKVEFPGLVEADKVKVTVNGEDAAKAFGKSPDFIAREAGKDQSALILRDVALSRPGDATIEVTTADGASRKVVWTIFETGPRKAKNVILFIGDGMSLSHRVAARLMSKGIAEGKTFGKLAMDDMPRMAMVATAGYDSIITDSANSASSYATGHKGVTGSLGVYADRTPSPFDDPRVETITSLARRKLDLAIGIVTNTEVQDATPAAMVAHTRRRGAYNEIVRQLFETKPDVLMGGGAAYFQPQAVATSKRQDDTDYIAMFRDAGYGIASTASEMRELAGREETRKLLALFTPANMHGVLDRKFLKGGGVARYPDQPDLTEQVQAALQILSRHDNGFHQQEESVVVARQDL